MSPPLSAALQLVRRLELRQRARWVFGLLDAALAAPTAAASAQMRLVRRVGMEYLPMNRAVLHRLGVIPAVDRYYDPFVSDRHLRHSLDDVRSLPGLDLHEADYEALFRALGAWGQEPIEGPLEGTELAYQYGNGTYGGYDAALLHAFIRQLRPRRILEVGSGNSTLVALRALSRNRSEGAACDHVCIEPFEMPWLERSGVKVLRERAEVVGLSPFEALRDGDLLFIDNSHIIRPQGDVLFLVQEVLPRLPPGVTVHIHDIFTPRDYPRLWLLERMLFWNEQYVVEALLTDNPTYRVLVPAHHVYTTQRALFTLLRPELASAQTMPPTSLWLRREPAAAPAVAAPPAPPAAPPAPPAAPASSAPSRRRRR